MDPIVLVMAGSVILLACGLVTWAWFAMTRDEDELRAAARNMPVRPALPGLA